jgi:hypothetical protein
VSSHRTKAIQKITNDTVDSPGQPVSPDVATLANSHPPWAWSRRPIQRTRNPFRITAGTNNTQPCSASPPNTITANLDAVIGGSNGHDARRHHRGERVGPHGRTSTTR